jgi:hypothetical protein
MGLLLQSEAAARATQMFACGETHEQPSDLIADIIQFCAYNNIDFEEQLSIARDYVQEEISFDAGTETQLLTNLNKRRNS